MVGKDLDDIDEDLLYYLLNYCVEIGVLFTPLATLG
jgi:hypothetical protein